MHIFIDAITDYNIQLKLLTYVLLSFRLQLFFTLYTFFNQP